MQLKEGLWRSEDCFIRKPYVCALYPDSGNGTTGAPIHKSTTTTNAPIRTTTHHRHPEITTTSTYPHIKTAAPKASTTSEKPTKKATTTPVATKAPVRTTTVKDVTINSDPTQIRDHTTTPIAKTTQSSKYLEN